VHPFLETTAHISNAYQVQVRADPTDLYPVLLHFAGVTHEFDQAYARLSGVVRNPSTLSTGRVLIRAVLRDYEGRVVGDLGGALEPLDGGEQASFDLEAWARGGPPIASYDLQAQGQNYLPQPDPPCTLQGSIILQRSTAALPHGSRITHLVVTVDGLEHAVTTDQLG
jgi:hypothetical protein